ncbi:ABC transporter permease [Labrys wisconsinensis]|uniref:Ribose transport system permease protein n=1 Tax=Labrys wisconsinensis TaxID=425677 RepID=A0ABU0JCQ7_9HYPH|nr:ABC transporter permease [Labrys wisconsinensis]MDQ0472073.1 ribose transport system permease protein [Labrys wisconsinensis]
MTAKADVIGAVPQVRLSSLVLRYSLHLLFVGVILAFSLALPRTYPTLINAQTIASTNAVLALLALAAIPTLVSGQFDLSIGFQLALAQSLCAGLIVYGGLSPLVAIGLTLAVGLALGAMNGWLVAYCGLNAFITTLATGIVIQGATQWYTDGTSIFGAMPGAFLGFGRATVLGVPLPCIYVILAGCALWFAYEHTSWGRRAFAIGGNSRAAELVGIPIRRMTLQAFVLGSLLSAVAGVLSAAMLGSANPNIGVNFLLPAFAAVFLGAAPLGPGRFNSWGTILAVYTLAAGIAGLQQLGAAFYVEQFFNGGALLAAIVLARWMALKRARTIA